MGRRFLWYSATPECQSGYGNTTRAMVTWLTKQGHYVPVGTKHPTDVRFRMWDVPGTEKAVPILCGTNLDVINDEVMDNWKMDACLSMFDIWVLKKPIKRHIPWIPIDTENVSEKIINKVKDCPMIIAMTQHGKRELERYDLEPEYAPIGFDPDVFHPDSDLAGEFREALQWKDGLKPDDMFLIGTVGLNYGDDRKGFVILLQAFKAFRDQHPEARLYLHTQANKKDEGINYSRIAHELGVMDYVAWANPAQLWFGSYTPEELAAVYSAFDVFCLPTRGEGFGMPVIEAQACGTPVIVTDNTSGPELCKTGRLIKTDSDDYVYTGLNTWRVQPKPSEVVDALERSLALWGKNGDYLESVYTEDAVEEYQWPNVWEKHWKPIIDKIEAMLPIEEPAKGE